jgi:hypothetical protein
MERWDGSQEAAAVAGVAVDVIAIGKSWWRKVVQFIDHPPPPGLYSRPMDVSPPEATA